jgi:putative copper export protein
MDTVFGVESPAFVAVRAVLTLSTVGLLGALMLRWAVLPRYAGPDAAQLRAAVGERLPRWIDGLGLVAVAATLARLAAQHAAVFGTDQWLTRESLATLLFRAGWGRTWWLAIAAAIVVTWVAPRLRRQTRSAWFVAAAAILLLAASQPLSGHPAAATMPRVAVATQWLHLVGAGGWVGSLALLTFVAIPAARRLEHDVTGDPEARIAGLVRAFSPTALSCAALLGVTGALAAWSNLGGFAPLWQSPYGRLLLLKLALLSVAAGTGAYNWRRVLPSLGAAAGSARLRRSSLIELTAMLLLLIVTAVLVATPMPGE